MIAGLAALGGAAAGVAQAGLLARAARRPSAALGLALRWLLVAAALALAARGGRLVPGAAGWLTGFAAAVLVIRRRLR